MQGLMLDPPVSRHRLTVDDFHRMLEAQILGEDDRVELVDGELVDMAPVNSAHAGALKHLNRLMVERLPDVIVGIQHPLALGPHSELYPDLALLRPRADSCAGGNPGPQDVLLLVEIAHTTVRYDAGVKAALYGAHGVPELWVLTLDPRQLTVFRVPVPDGYLERSTLTLDTEVAPLLLPQLVLKVGSLFPSD
jgi:Uma2 family endonuclease